MLRRVVASVAAFALLAGCVWTSPLPQETPPLEDAERAFNNDLRWGRWQEAARHVDPDDRSAFLRLLDDPSSPFHFTAVDELSREEMAKDGTEIEVLMVLEYYRLPSVKERTVRQRQHWRFDVASKEWIVTPDMSVLHELVPGAPPAPHTHTSESAGFR